MTPLRQRMTEDMELRGLSRHTQRAYVQYVAIFAQYFHKSPELLGPAEIRAFQLYLTQERHLSPSSIAVAVAALRFLYKTTLKRDWNLDDVLPFGRRRPQHLPVVMSPAEVAHTARPSARLLAHCPSQGVAVPRRRPRTADHPIGRRGHLSHRAAPARHRQTGHAARVAPRLRGASTREQVLTCAPSSCCSAIVA
jgi:hypothetical protein